MNNIKIRLIVMNFLQFAVWGAYLTSMGNFLGANRMGDLIAWFYAIQGIVAIFMPTIMGIIADRYISPTKLLGICHAVAGVAMLTLAFMGSEYSEVQPAERVHLFVAIYTISVAFYMPTLALSNTVAFNALKANGLDTVKTFPSIRVFGTIGFILMMWFVNCAVFEADTLFTFDTHPGKFQYTHMQFFASGVIGILLFLYCFTLPKDEKPVARKATKLSLFEAFGLNAFALFKSKKMALFFIFSMLLGMSLQVTNSFAGPFLTSFISSPDPAISSSFAANNATLLTSLSQISEALCILLIPFFMSRFGIKNVMLIAMLAWMLRFGFFGIGSPTMPGVILFVLSCVVYGVAFDFFNVSGAMFVDKETDPSLRASAQGLFMLMTNGLGATIGTLSAGAVVNHFCQWTDGFLVGDWQSAWLVFATFALIVAVLFMIFFKDKTKA